MSGDRERDDAGEPGKISEVKSAWTAEPIAGDPADDGEEYGGDCEAINAKEIKREREERDDQGRPCGEIEQRGFAIAGGIDVAAMEDGMDFLREIEMAEGAWLGREVDVAGDGALPPVVGEGVGGDVEE